MEKLYEVVHVDENCFGSVRITYDPELNPHIDPSVFQSGPPEENHR